MQRSRMIGVLLYCLLASPMARAAVTYDVFALAQKKIKLTGPDAISAQGGTIQSATWQGGTALAGCTLKLTAADEVMEQNPGSCDVLWDQAQLKKVDLSIQPRGGGGGPPPAITVTLDPVQPVAAPAGRTVTYGENKFTLQAGATNEFLAVYVPAKKGFVMATGDKTLSVTTADRASLPKPVEVYVKTADLAYFKVELDLEKQDAARQEEARKRAEEDRRKLNQGGRLDEQTDVTLEFNLANPDSGCVRPPGFSRHYILCVDTLGSTLEPGSLLPSGHVINPNIPVLVLVRHERRMRVRVSMGGQVGLFEPGIRDNTGRDGKATAGPGDEPTPPLDVIVSRYPFAPRLPGQADIRIRMDEPGKPQTLQSLTLQFIIEKTYAGAIRVGVASVFGGAVDREYAVQTRPGSDQPEIVATSNSAFDLELTLGFAPFLEFFNGGRSYFQGRGRLRFAPYVGIGLLNQKQNALETLKSLHLGIEAEPNPHFSVALTLVGRRVTRLSPPASVGSPGDPSGPPTSTGYQLGVGVVLNVSPDFLRFATMESSEFFQ